jgi:catechol 2,3-dioxygenase-like lactoylglutathione lyase family enzyme
MNLVPELLVTNLQASLAFWCNRIGFTISYDRPEENFAYLARDGAEVMLEQIDPSQHQWLTAELSRPFGRGINFQIEISNLNSILNALHETGWPLFMEPEEKTYRTGQTRVTQRQFLVQDPDGYLLRLCETVNS